MKTTKFDTFIVAIGLITHAIILLGEAIKAESIFMSGVFIFGASGWLYLLIQIYFHGLPKIAD